MNLIKFGAVFFLVFCLTFSPVYAHDDGESWEQTVGEYTLDIGYEPDSLVAGNSVRLDFEILDSKTEKPVKFTDVWVRITGGGQAVFSGGLHRYPQGSTALVVNFPKTGEYEMSVKFSNGSTNLAEGIFPISISGNQPEDLVVAVEPKAKNSPIFLVGALSGIAVCVFLLGTYALYSRNRKSL